MSEFEVCNHHSSQLKQSKFKHHSSQINKSPKYILPTLRTSSVEVKQKKRDGQEIKRMNASVLTGTFQKSLLRGGSSLSSATKGFVTRPQHQHQHQHRHYQQQQVRHLPYVPLAYQRGAVKALKEKAARPKPRSGRSTHYPKNNNHTADNNKRGRTSYSPSSLKRREGRARNRRHTAEAGSHIINNNNNSNNDTTTGDTYYQKRSSWEYILQDHKDDLLGLQKKLEGTLSAYRTSLSQSTTPITDPTTAKNDKTTEDQTVTDNNDNDNDNNDHHQPNNRRKKTTKNSNNKITSLSTSQQATVLIAQLPGIHAPYQPHSWNHVQDTEHGYREICSIVGDMITVATKIQILSLKDNNNNNHNNNTANNNHNNSNSSSDESHDLTMTYYSGIAEQLLEGWIDLQKDRMQFVEKARESTINRTNEASISWFGWLKQATTANNENNNKNNQDDIKKNVPVLVAHEDPNCGPQMEHFQKLADAVLSSLREDLMDRIQTPFRNIRRAQRLKRLLEKMPSNVEPDVEAVRTVIHAFAMVGSYESARAGESLAERYPHMQDELLTIVLHGYYLASRSSPRNQERSKAAIRADELVRQRWATDNDNATANNDYNDDDDSNSSNLDNFEEQKFVHGTKALLCLHAVGTDALPDVCKRADYIADLCLGRENLEEVFRNGNLEGLWKMARPQITMPFLNCLTLIYTSSGDSSRIQLAKRLLLILMKDSDFQSSKDINFPDLRTCKAVVSELNKTIKYNRPDPSSRKDFTTLNVPKVYKDALQKNLDYGLELLDLMMARSQCWPDQWYFHTLLRMLPTAKPSNPGAIAEQILSKMHIRQCFGSPGFSLAIRKTYHYVLLAWLSSAKSGVPDTAKRIVEILDAMEAQSLPLLARDSYSKESDAYNNYVAPDSNTFHLALQVCTAVRIDSEKEEALEIALAIHDRMKRRGIQATSKTFSMLFACANLLPESSSRRQNVTEQLLEDARQQGNVNEDVLKRHKLQGGGGNGGLGSGSSSFSSDSVAGGLLADLS